MQLVKNCTSFYHKYRIRPLNSSTIIYLFMFLSWQETQQNWLLGCLNSELRFIKRCFGFLSWARFLLRLGVLCSGYQSRRRAGRQASLTSTAASRAPRGQVGKKTENPYYGTINLPDFSLFLSPRVWKGWIYVDIIAVALLNATRLLYATVPSERIMYELRQFAVIASTRFYSNSNFPLGDVWRELDSGGVDWG